MQQLVGCVTITGMGLLLQDSVQRSQKATPEEKAAQGLELIEAGLWLKRAGLRARYPGETELQIERRLREWLLNG